MDGSGDIDKKELKACLYSLGEEKSSSEVENILKSKKTSTCRVLTTLTEYGDGKLIKYEGFKELMIDTLGVTDTKEDILKSFELINKGAEIAKEDLMELVMEAHDVQYVKETAPKVSGGYDYKSWTDDVFSR